MILSSVKYTKSLGSFINKIREGILGYGHETFATLLYTTPSGSFYMCGGSRKRKDTGNKKESDNRRIGTDHLYKILIMAYNASLFMDRCDTLNLLKANGDKKTNIKSLEKLFGTKNSLLLKYNPHQVVVPYEIFRNGYYSEKQEVKKATETMKINESETEVEVTKFGDFNMNYREKIAEALNTFFNQEYMPGCKPFLPLVEYERLNFEDKKRLDVFIANFVEDEFLNELNDSEKRESKWIYSLYYRHKIVNIHPHLERYINNVYLSSTGDKCNWYAVFEKLSHNKSISELNKYPEDFVGFKDKTSQITRHNLPIFYYRYKPVEGLSQSRYHEDIQLAEKGKIRLIHLYMILFNMYRNDNFSENDAFIKSCYRIGGYGIKTLFDNPHLDLYTPPADPIIKLGNKNQEDFHAILHDFFETAELDPRDEDDLDLINFRDNRNLDAYLFMRTISFDFKIIKDLNKAMADELKTELEKTVQRYKDENKL